MRHHLSGTLPVVLATVAALGPAPARSTTEAGTAPVVEGKIAYSFSTDNLEIFSMNPDGSARTNLTNHPAYDTEPAWSRDGSRIAFASDRDDPGGPFDVFTMNADGSSQVNLTDGDKGSRPTWSPDGTMLAFQRDFDIWIMGADGSNPMNLTNRGATDVDASWSPDGSRIAFSSTQSGNTDVHVINVDGSGEDNLTEDAALDRYPAWSPDGGRIAYISDKDGGYQTFLINPDGTDRLNITNDSSAGESEPAWSPDGARIVYHTPTDTSFELFAMNRDGSNRVNLSQSAEHETDPAWQSVAVPEPSVSKAKTREGKPAVFKVTIPPTSQPISYVFDTDPGKAKRRDFKAKQGTVTFPPGETRRKIKVKTKEDGGDEPNESFFLDVGYPAGPSDRGRARIKDDD